MFVVTIEQEVDDDFFGHWKQRSIYILDTHVSPEQAVYEALHRWIKTLYSGSVRECMDALGIEDNALQVTVYYGSAPGTMRRVWQEKFTPLDHWAGGRHTSSAPVHCAICEWYGAMHQMTHGYTLNFQYEVEPLDRCPQCRAVLT